MLHGRTTEWTGQPPEYVLAANYTQTLNISSKHTRAVWLVGGTIQFDFISDQKRSHEGHAKRKKKLTRSRTITSSKRTKQKKTLRHQFSVNIGIRTPYNFVFSVARVWRSTIGLGQSTWTPGCSTQTVLWMIASTAHVHISLKIHLYSTQHSIHIGWRRRRRWWQQWCSRTVQLCRYNALRWAIHTFSVCCLPFHSS